MRKKHAAVYGNAGPGAAAPAARLTGPGPASPGRPGPTSAAGLGCALAARPRRASVGGLGPGRTALLGPAFAALLGFGLAGCADAAGPPDGSHVRLSLAVAPFSGAAAPAAAAAFGPGAVPVRDTAGRTLDLAEVAVVLEEVELERAEVPDCDSSGPGNPCQEFEAGPVLVELPLAGGLVTPFATRVPAGTYDEVEFELDAPEDDDAAARAFRAAHPSWPRSASVRVRGTFDAGGGPQPFDVYLSVEAELELELEPPLVVAPDTDPRTIHLTVQVDVGRWFRDADGSLIDPRALAADSRLRQRVEENIRASFEAFRDDDRDGHR